MPSAPVVQTRDLCRRFGRRWALARIDLVVEEGERILLLGANGSGKSTLLNILATLMPATRGQLRLFGMDPSRQRSAIRRRVGIVRHAHGLYEDLSARDNLVFRSRITGAGRVDVAALLTRVGLDDRPEPLRTYSAGMRKRLQLAALEVEAPDLVLLDEPYAALDPAGCADVSAFIRSRTGTVIIASHQVERAAAVCTRAVLLDQGLLRWTGPADRAWEAWRKVQEESARTDVGAA